MYLVLTFGRILENLNHHKASKWTWVEWKKSKEEAIVLEAEDYCSSTHMLQGPRQLYIRVFKYLVNRMTKKKKSHFSDNYTEKIFGFY